jgi:glutathione S-transferase
MAALLLCGQTECAATRLVAMTLEVAGVPYEYEDVDVGKKDHWSQEFQQVPSVLIWKGLFSTILSLRCLLWWYLQQQTLPAIKDDDFVMSESRAIAGYLAETYNQKGFLYPRDVKVRARVDQRMFFDWAVFSEAFSNVVV